MRRKEKKQYIEEMILKAIITELEVKDLSEMSSDEIARRAGICKRTLYQYFTSKKEMYLGVVEYCFKELSEVMEREIQGRALKDPYAILECIGYNYLRYCLSSRAKCKIIVSFNENDYNEEFPKQVNDIIQYSKKFEISVFVKRFYQLNSIKPAVSINSISLYIWAHIQGLAALILSKKSWIEDYYQVDFDELIEEHLELSKSLLLGVKNEEEK